MVVVTSRQAGERPETIRTRLARFMPTRAASGWSITWSAHTERPEEIGDEDQLRASDHLGCFGAAVAHALAQANVAATRLAVTAQTVASAETTPQPIVVEVRAEIPGIPQDQSILETILRRVEVPCATWKALAAEVGVRVTGVLEDTTARETAVARTDAAPAAQPPQPSAPPRPADRRWRPHLPSVPRWLTLRLGVLLVAMISGVAALAHH